MKLLLCAVSVAALILATSGCAALTHYNTNDQAGSGHTTYFVDAKQRVVSTGKTNDRETGNELYMVCAEPSPDALSAIAAAQGLSLSQGDIQAALSNSITEGAGSIGLRTQSIQLMRDSMYRLCEAHMSGFIGDLAFETLHRRFQSSMVAILAIEQLTSVARPPAITLGGVSGSAAVDLVAESSELMQRADRDYKAASEATKKAQEEFNEAKTALEKRKPAEDGTPAPVPEGEPSTEELQNAFKAKETALAVAKKREAELKEELEYFQSARRAALAGSRTEVRLDIESGRGPSPQDTARIAEMSEAVQEIVLNTLTLSFTDELCTTVLVASADGQLYQRTGGRDDDQQGLSDSQLKLLKPLNDKYTKLLDDINKKEIELAPKKAQLAALSPAAAGYASLRDSAAELDAEISGLLMRLKEVELQRTQIIGNGAIQADLRGNEVIDSCLRALDQRASSERDLAYAKQTWEYAKADALRAAIAGNPGDLVAVINALADLERAKNGELSKVSETKPDKTPSGGGG